MMKKFYLILTCAALCACGGNGKQQEQFRKLFKVGTVFSSETGTISEFAVKQ